MLKILVLERTVCQVDLCCAARERLIPNWSAPRCLYRLTGVCASTIAQMRLYTHYTTQERARNATSRLRVKHDLMCTVRVSAGSAACDYKVVKRRRNKQNNVYNMYLVLGWWRRIACMVCDSYVHLISHVHEFATSGVLSSKYAGKRHLYFTYERVICCAYV